ncbi:alpha/beta fold hydrolase [Siminovitchia sediminis]|uniref:Alpha/beta fold hydrolase n=1 Tax=Siminovitchia sediminis TaxID=1274353 RepID=A0ABW4KL52_9BACI
MKKAGIFLISLVGVLVLVFTSSFVYHRIQLSKEKNLFVPNGQMVEVNGEQLHVYVEGNGKDTLVFLSGGGTSSPVLDFKTLYSQLSDRYQIAVVEKFGYGFSDITDSSRNIDVILSETREALAKAGVKAPYVLMPHSMSGIEALYWARLYPNEVKAIIGLDMAVPETYDHYKVNLPLIHLSAFAAHIGIPRWIPSLATNDAIKHGNLTEEEKELYRAVLYRRTLTKTMVNEVSLVESNAKRVQETKSADVPILLFSSNGDGTGMDQNEWINIQREFVDKANNRKLIKLDCSHSIHNLKYDRIAKKSAEFIDSL